jgi:peroxiredoxin
MVMPGKKLKKKLQEALDKQKKAWTSEATRYKIEVYEEGMRAIERSNIILRAKQVGDAAPDFELRNTFGKTVILKDYLKKGPVVLVWYRGGWCPYCNITLQFLQRALPGFKNEGANLIALTPELPDNSISMKEKNRLEFEVLSDIGNQIGKLYGVVYRLTAEVAEIYQNGFGLHEYNGDESNELPALISATFWPDINSSK